MDKKAFDELINNINDKIFKTAFKQKESVIEYLQIFLTDIASKLDLENLMLSDTNFVSEDLEEYFCDVVFETTLKDEHLKNKIRVILLFEHKKGIDSYFDLYLQLLFYIALIWKHDRKERRSPTIVLPLVINQSKRRIKQKTLHDSLKGIPDDLFIYIPQFQYHVLNVQPLDNKPIDEKILNLNSKHILRSLLLSYIAIEHKDKLDNILIEIFKFYKNNPHQRDYFHQLFVFLVKEGYFSNEEIKELLKEYLSEKESNNMLTTAQVWKQEGRQEGLQEGMQQGMQQGEYNKARLVCLRGIFMQQNASLLSDLTGLSTNEVNTLVQAFERVKRDFLLNDTNGKKLLCLSSLSESEVQYVIQCLENKA